MTPKTPTEESAASGKEFLDRIGSNSEVYAARASSASGSDRRFHVDENCRYLANVNDPRTIPPNQAKRMRGQVCANCRGGVGE